MNCPNCDAKVSCVESSPGPVSQGTFWHEEGLGWHVHVNKTLSLQVFQCANNHKWSERWQSGCRACMVPDFFEKTEI